MGPFEPPSVLYKNRKHKHTKVTVTKVTQKGATEIRVLLCVTLWGGIA